MISVFLIQNITRDKTYIDPQQKFAYLAGFRTKTYFFRKLVL